MDDYPARPAGPSRRAGRKHAIAACVGATLMACLPGNGVIAAEAALPARESRANATDHHVDWFPEVQPYPHYLADPMHASVGVTFLGARESRVPGASTGRIAVRAGDLFPIIAMHPAGDPNAAWFVNLELSFSGQFDRGNNASIIGWDGTYALLATHAFGQGWGLKTGWHHRSTHLGDEYIEDTGSVRIGYTREEFLVGLSRRFGRGWRAYGEAGYATKVNADIGMEDWRLQGGLEYEAREAIWRRHARWYGAANVASFQERGWNASVAAEAGVIFLPEGRYRLAAGLYRGRVPVSQFFMEDETYFTIGLLIER